MSLNRICQLCNFVVEGTVFGCYIDLDRTKRLEVTGCEKCIRNAAQKARNAKKMTIDEMKELIGLIEN